MVASIQEALEADSLALPDRVKERPDFLELEFSDRQRLELEMAPGPSHVLSLHIKCKPGHLKVLRSYEEVECWAVDAEGQAQPLELVSCRLMKHDMGRGFWTYFALARTLPGAGKTVRLRLSGFSDKEVN